MKLSIKDFSSKCDQIRRKLPIWSHLLKKSLMENFIFCAVTSRPPLRIKKWNHFNQFRWTSTRLITIEENKAGYISTISEGFNKVINNPIICKFFKDFTYHRKKINTVVVFSSGLFPNILNYGDYQWHLPTIWKTRLRQTHIEEFSWHVRKFRLTIL